MTPIKLVTACGCEKIIADFFHENAREVVYMPLSFPLSIRNGGIDDQVEMSESPAKRRFIFKGRYGGTPKEGIYAIYVEDRP